jgi:tetratricopeptide (TPR) repeat protein
VGLACELGVLVTAVPRRCDVCGGRLAQDTASRLCATCQRTALTAPLPAFDAPPEAGRRDDAPGRSQGASAALAAADRGEAEPAAVGEDALAPLLGVLRDLLVSLRSQAGLTQEELADRIGYSRSAVGGAESLKRVPAESFWRRTDEVLDGRGALLRAYRQLAEARAERARAARRRADLKRQARVRAWRTSLPEDATQPGLATAVRDGLRTAHEWLVLEPPQVQESRAGRRIGAGLLDTLDQRVTELRYLDDRLAGRDTHELVSRELNATMTLMQEAAYTEAIGRRLSSMTGELAQLAGWVSSDAGLYEQAARYYVLGAKAAHAAGNYAVAANNLSSLAYQLTNLGSTADAVLVARSVASGGRNEPAIVQALLLERVAWAHAKAGDSRQTERALEAVEEALARGRSDRDPPWLYWLDKREADVMAGRCYTELRRPLRAVPLLEQAIATYPEEAAREVALYLSWLAVAYADAREVDEACRIARRVLDITQTVHSARADGRLAAVLSRLAEYGDTQSVWELREAAQDRS